MPLAVALRGKARPKGLLNELLTAGRALAAFVAICFFGPAMVAAQEDDSGDSMHQPIRVTAGVADQLLGQVAPDGRTLFYVSNPEVSTEIFTMDLREGRTQQVFDEGVEVTWPRVSPDGKLLLYISYLDQATGQLCVRELPSGTKRRCFAEPGARQAEWIDATHIALVERPSVQDDLRLLQITVGSRLNGQPMVKRSLTSPAVSADGQWLVYIPVDRDVRQVGAGFASHAGGELELLHIADNSAKPFKFQLPGVPAQPNFSRDGHFLYFVQFLADTNGDGVTDASDHGVLFRVPFTASDADPAGALSHTLPEQLTDDSWNCQYPQTTPDKLFATCAQDDNLDVFELPLSGAIPETWSNDRLREEVDMSTSLPEQLLIYRRMVSRLQTGRSLGFIRLVALHLARNQFDAAHFYAEQATKLEEPISRGLGRRLVTWVLQRRQAWERARGRDIDSFANESRERLEALRPASDDSPVALALGHLVASEIAQSFGDFGLAKSELEAEHLTPDLPRSILELTRLRSDELYRLLDDRDALLRWSRTLATFPKSSPDVSLRLARAYVRQLVRGLSSAEADRALAHEAEVASSSSELAFAVELAQVIRLIKDEHSVPARQALVALYQRQTRSDRRHALMTDAIERASALGFDRVIETLAQTYVEDTKPKTPERPRAEQLFRHAILGRAYRRRAEGKLNEARADFDLVVKQTHSLEALIGSLELRIKAGEKTTTLISELEKSDLPHWLVQFAHAYLVAHDIRDFSGDEHRQQVEAASTILRKNWQELHGQRLAQSLSGSIRHESFLVTHDPLDAERAATRYIVGIKGLRSNLRQKAMLLGQIALLHTEVGNYRLALGYLEQREKLPYLDNSAGLAIRLDRARALLHVGREGDAAKVADEALAMTEGAKRLAEYRPLALDRAALYNLAAGRFARSLKLYDLELPTLATNNGAEAVRNRVVVRLAHAAAALGAKQPKQTVEDIAIVKGDLAEPTVAQSLKWSHADAKQVLRAYHIIAAGLEANAFTELNQTNEALTALEQREQQFAEQLAETERDADERAMILVSDRLAEQAAEAGDGAKARQWAQKSLAHADAFGKLTSTSLGSEQAISLWFASELAAFDGSDGNSDLSKRLTDALDLLAKRDGRKWEIYRRWFELCLGLLAPK